MHDVLSRRSANKGLAWIWVLWVLFFAPFVFYVFVANSIGVEGSVTGGAADDVFTLAKYVLYVVAVVLLVLIFLLHRSFRKRGSVVNQLTHSWSAVGRQILVTAVGGVLCQAIGTYGLICFLLDGDFVSLYALVGIGALTLVFLRPRKQDLTCAAP